MTAERLALDLEVESIPMSRAWAMPSADTFMVPPITAFVQRWWRSPSVDPFARNSMRATYRNDLSPDTKAEFHLDAVDFLDLMAARGVRAELIVFDPPYSPRQVAEVYQSIGQSATTTDTQTAALYRRVRDGLDRLLVPGGIALSFGWNSAGFGRHRDYRIEELLLVSHGGAHNDTICLAERKGRRFDDLARRDPEESVADGDAVVDRQLDANLDDLAAVMGRTKQGDGPERPAVANRLDLDVTVAALLTGPAGVAFDAQVAHASPPQRMVAV